MSIGVLGNYEVGSWNMYESLLLFCGVGLKLVAVPLGVVPLPQHQRVLFSFSLKETFRCLLQYRPECSHCFISLLQCSQYAFCLASCSSLCHRPSLVRHTVSGSASVPQRETDLKMSERARESEGGERASGRVYKREGEVFIENWGFTAPFPVKELLKIPASVSQFFWLELKRT